MLMEKLENRPSAIAEHTPGDVHRALAGGALVIDGRSPEAYDACHLPGSVNVPMQGGELASRLRTAVGRNPWAIAVAGSDDESLSLAVMLERIGCPRGGGIVAGGVDAYRAAGYPVGHQYALTADRVVADLELGGAVLVDARDDEDWVRGHVPGSLHVPLRSAAAAAPLLPQTPVVVACTDGRRAATAATILRRGGHANIWRLAGGGLPYLLSRRLNLGGI
jgi:hydroxyacylglutathione hydrolase